jgi:hypothetical protein
MGKQSFRINQEKQNTIDGDLEKTGTKCDVTDKLLGIAP